MQAHRHTAFLAAAQTLRPSIQPQNQLLKTAFSNGNIFVRQKGLCVCVKSWVRFDGNRFLSPVLDLIRVWKPSSPSCPLSLSPCPPFHLALLLYSVSHLQIIFLSQPGI